jgi:hypothetical protein
MNSTPRTRRKKRERAPVGSHQDFDVSSRVETIQLVDELQHRPLHLVITASTVVKTSATNGINFIEEDDTCFLAARHLEEFPDHTRTLADVLLDKF